MATRNIDNHRDCVLYLVISFLVTCTSLAVAGVGSKYQSASRRPGAGLDKIFSSSSSYGPLGQDRNIVEAGRMLLMWNEPPSQSVTSYDAYHYQVWGYDSATSQLNEYGSLSGDSVTDAVDGSVHPAIQGNMNSIVLAGDMIGDGYAEEASVWESANHELFASAMPVSKTDLAFEDSTVTGELVGSLTSTISDFTGEISATLSDLTSDGRKDLVIAWNDPTDNKVHIAVYGWSQSAASHLTLISSIADLSTNTSFSDASLVAIAAGDFKQDGRNEIALAGFSDPSDLYIKLYSLDSSDNLLPEAESTFSTSVRGLVNFVPYTAPSGNIARLAMAAGDFTGDNYKDCIALCYVSYGIPFLNFSAAGAVYIAQPDTSLDSIAVSNIGDATLFTTPDQFSGIADAISLQCGDLNGSGTDQVVIGAGNEVNVFNVQENSGYLEPVLRSSTTVPGPTADSTDYTYSNSYLKVGDVNRDGKDEVVVLRNSYASYISILPPYSSGDVETFDLTVLASADTNYDLYQLASLTNFQTDSTGLSATSLRHYSLALGNFDQGGLMLGVPTHFYVPGVVQPLVILNAPPVHFDVFDGKSYDICNVFNKGSNAGAFATTYNQSTSNTDMMETTVKSSWGVGASLSGSASYLGGKVEASLDTHYGQDFSKEQKSSYQNTVSVNVSAQQEDEIYAIITNYDLWEYPLLDSGQVRGHVLVTVPSPPEGEWFDTESWTAYSFIPDHVVGDVLSYLTYDSLADNPYMYQKIKGSLSDGFELGTGKFSWSLTTQDFTSSNVSTSETFKLNVSAKATIGGSFGGFGASVSAGVSGDYSNSSLTSHTSSVTSTLGLTATLGSVNQTIGEDQYIVTPYSYWGDNGALVVDYAVEPVLAAPGGTETWWQQMYGHAPDPAFALPYLYWPQEGFTVQDPEKIYQTKEIFSDPSDPAPGDTVTTTVRIHNYSLVPTDTSVTVSFYVGNPQNGGSIIKGLSGDSVFTTSGSIAARSSQIFSFRWIAPYTVNTRLIHSGNYVHIWGVIDPQDTVSEIHKKNDMAWSILQVPGITTGVDGQNRLPLAFRLDQNYPNPFNPSTAINYQLSAISRVTLKVYDILGREVAILVDGEQNAGAYSASFNASRFASGVYFYRLVAAEADGARFVATKKLMLLK